MKKNLICIAVATTFGLVAFTASAEEDMYRGAWYALPGIGYNWTDSDVNSDDDVAARLRFGKELSEHWDIQIGGAYTKADEDNSTSTSGKYKQTLLGVDALYMFSRNKFRPFVLAGVGIANNYIDYDNATWGGSKTSPMANVGLGAQYLFSDKWGMQADVREVWSEARTGPAGDHDTETVRNTLLSLGIMYRFGEPTPVAAVAEPEPAPAPVAAPEPAPAPVECKYQADQIVMASSTLFDFDKSDLKPEGKAALDTSVVEKMKTNPIYVTVRIEGHTDYLGSDEYNQALSERRANTVRDYVIAQGVEPDRLVAVGMGEDIPLVDCKDAKGTKALIECLAPNRRVEILATRTKQEGCQ